MAFKPKSLKPTKTIADLITPEDKFIGSAKADLLESRPEQTPSPSSLLTQTPGNTDNSLGTAVIDDLHMFVRRRDWPTTPLIMPSVAEGREDLCKSQLIRLPENLWLSLDRHCKALGVSKSAWIRHALLKLMREEQEFFAEKG